MKPIKIVGFILAVSSFIFFNEVNEFANSISSGYAPDCGQYILFYIGCLMIFYNNTCIYVKLLAGLISFRLLDEVFFDDNIVNSKDLMDVILLIVLSLYNYKNVK